MIPPTKSTLCLKCLIKSMFIGVLFSLTFTNLSIMETLWVGLISFIGADAIYKTFEDKIFNSLSKIDTLEEIERTDKS